MLYLIWKFAGKSVGVIGGGDAGFENALILAERHGCQVRMLLRNHEFCARPEFIERVRAHSNIQFFPIPTLVSQFQDLGDRVRLILQVRGQTDSLELDGLFIRIGTEPVLPKLSVPLGRDEMGYVQVDAEQRTNIPGLLAAGDVTAQPLRLIATAVGSGAQAAHTAATQLGFL